MPLRGLCLGVAFVLTLRCLCVGPDSSPLSLPQTALSTDDALFSHPEAERVSAPGASIVLDFRSATPASSRLPPVYDVS